MRVLIDEGASFFEHTSPSGFLFRPPRLFFKHGIPHFIFFASYVWGMFSSTSFPGHMHAWYRLHFFFLGIASFFLLIN